MAIVTSTHKYLDNGRWIREMHTDHLGAVYEYLYPRDAMTDEQIVAKVTARAPFLEEKLATEEVEALING